MNVRAFCIHVVHSPAHAANSRFVRQTRTEALPTEKYALNAASLSNWFVMRKETLVSEERNQTAGNGMSGFAAVYLNDRCHPAGKKYPRRKDGPVS